MLLVLVIAGVAAFLAPFCIVGNWTGCRSDFDELQGELEAESLRLDHLEAWLKECHLTYSFHIDEGDLVLLHVVCPDSIPLPFTETSQGDDPGKEAS